MCDEISFYEELFVDQIAGTGLSDSYGTHIPIEEFLEGRCTEAVLYPGGVWGKNVIRFYIAGKAKNQLSTRVDKFTAVGIYRRTQSSVVPDSIKNPVGGDLVIGLTYIEPKAIEVERLCVVLVG